MEVVTALGIPILVPKDMLRAVRRNSHRATVFNQTGLSVDLLNSPSMVLKRRVFQNSRRETNMRVPLGIKDHFGEKLFISRRRSDIHLEPARGICRTKCIFHSARK